MTKYLLCLVLILLFSNAVAVAQPIYGWQDEKEQWHFSDVVPAGIAAKRIVDGIPASDSGTSRSTESAKCFFIG